MIEHLEKRIHRLESIEAIRSLKARYLACCDAKDPAGMRACFADGKIEIDYGAVGQFDNADALVEIYTSIACHPHMVEMHHGSNPQIELIAPEHAAGKWSLKYQLINTTDNTLTQLGGTYDDEYRLTDDGWKISVTKFSVSSTLVLQLGDSEIKKIFAGQQMPMPE